MQKPLIVRTVYALAAFVLIVGILYFAKLLLMPLAIAGVLALVFMPVCDLLERKGINRVFASLICGLIFLLFMSGIIALLMWHVKNISGDLTAIGQNFSDMMGRLQEYLHQKLGLPSPRQQDLLMTPPTPGTNGLSKTVAVVMGGLVNVIITLILILVYTIMLLCQRHRFKEFCLQLAPVDTQSQTKMMLLRSVRVVQHYLYGLAVVIVCLWVMYSVGFAIVGIRNAVFFAILCGLLEIVPFVGNLTGSTLTSLMALSQGGGVSMVLGVLGTYALIQFIQFYLISPMVMRAQLNVNPLFTIFILIAGELIWGIPGMILAIPFLGIAKILFDNVKILQPLGYLIGREKSTPSRIPWLVRVKTWFYGGVV
ncbi:MAG: AI-2E family transporter [Bacteroidota bacterium]|nr:AI-2E family transporter [Bacteroidota bacterium]